MPDVAERRRIDSICLAISLEWVAGRWRLCLGGGSRQKHVRAAVALCLCVGGGAGKNRASDWPGVLTLQWALGLLMDGPIN